MKFVSYLSRIARHTNITTASVTIFKKPNIFLDDEKINKNNKKKS